MNPFHTDKNSVPQAPRPPLETNGPDGIVTAPSLAAFDEEALQPLGWNEAWSEPLAAAASRLQAGGLSTAGLEPARIVAQFSHLYRLAAADGEHLAEVTGRYAHGAASRTSYPAVGDWVLSSVPKPGDSSRASIHALLERRSALIRKEAGQVQEGQVVAANIDVLFLTMALNHDFNLRRIERYLVAAWESGATPVVLLTKADLADDPEALVREVEGAAPGVAVHAVSAQLGQGLEQLRPYLQPGRTIAVAGSSGVGKSTLLNELAGEASQRVQGVRGGDDRGRHTTTHRELFRLPGGALLMDTPGMRELQLWDEGGSSSAHAGAFADIEELASQCRFGDCTHGKREQGCAIKSALASGELDAGRYENYLKTGRELARVARKEQSAARKSLPPAHNKQRRKQERRSGKEAAQQWD
ncbi:ribosome small subunit-dependent GTPase A [Paenibacillus sp. FSL W8-1187]|uniref:ribosome small subunit-dependent GTPase A n=1 Tax=Paenibacillus sp. FSL W8-1187 TaxID=2975339 RepID=UPI0030DD82FB